MAAKVILNPSSTINQVITCSSGDMFPPRCQSSLGQVCLPKKKPEISSTSFSFSCNKPLKLEHSSSLMASPSICTPRENERPPSFSRSELSQLWREVQGCNNWEDLVQPLHPLLRQEIIRYGEFVIACYKAFDLDPASKRYLRCKYGKSSMFQEVGLESCGYEVTKYIYATPDVNLSIPIQGGGPANCGRWIGYVAVASDEEAIRRLGRRDILIAFRGTVTNSEWIANLMSSLTPARLDPNNPREEVKVESGFLSLYTSDEIGDDKFGLVSCREQLLSEVSRLLKKYKGEEISISLAGHSMGSSLAVLLAYDITELGLNKAGRGRDVPVAVYSFGGPRVGNLGFKERCEELGVKVLRIVNVNDPITKLPGVFLNESSINSGVFGGKLSDLSWNSWSFSCYAHVGVELVLDFFNVQNPSCVHDLDAYINLLKFPNKAVEKFQNGEQIDLLLNKVKEFLLNRGRAFDPDDQPFNAQLLKDFVSNLVNLVHSQRVDYLVNVHILGWVNLLALYMIL